MGNAIDTFTYVDFIFKNRDLFLSEKNVDFIFKNRDLFLSEKNL